MDQHGITTRHHKSRYDITIKFQKSHSELAQGLAVSDNRDVASLCSRAVGSEKMNCVCSTGSTQYFIELAIETCISCGLVET